MSHKSANPIKSGAKTIQSDTIRAAMEHRDIGGHKADHTCSGALEVITTAGLVYNTRANQQLFLTSMCYAVLTASKNCTFELGWCDAAGGGGTFHCLTARRYMETGANPHPDQTTCRTFSIPYHIGSHLARSISFRVNGGDATTHIMISWRGFFMRVPNG